jgi:hypothetical protein
LLYQTNYPGFPKKSSKTVMLSKKTPGPTARKRVVFMALYRV